MPRWCPPKIKIRCRMPSADLFAAQPAVLPRWLSIVGIGEDGIEGLSADAREKISRANPVFGGMRHLALAGAVRFEGARSARATRPARLCARIR